MPRALSKRICLSILLAIAAAVPAVAQKPIPFATLNRKTPVSFEKEVLPIFRKKCLACHSATEAYGEIVLETPQAVIKGGDSGPGLVPGNSLTSLILRLASHQQKPVMPPVGNDVSAANLTSAELGLLKLWIDQGAKGSITGNILSPTQWSPLPKRVNPIYAVAVSNDGQFAACGRANQIFIYHVPTGQLITRLSDPALVARSADKRPGIAHLDVVQSLAFNPDGDLLASGGFRTVKLWRFPRDVQQRKVEVAAEVTAIAVAPIRMVAATASADHSIRMWNLETGETLQTLTGHTDRITSLRFAADGKLISGSLDQSIRLWNGGQLVGRIDTPAAVNAITMVQTPPPPTPAVDPMAGGQTAGDQAATAATATEAAEAAAGQDAAAEPAEPAPVVELLASGGADNLIHYWDLPTGLAEPLADTPEKADVLAVSPDRKLFALANSAGVIRVVDADTGKLVQTWQAHESAVTDIAFQVVPEPPAAPAPAADAAAQAADDPAEPAKVVRRLATSSADGTVKVWNYDSAELLTTLRGSVGAVTRVAFHPANPEIAAGDADGHVSIWKLATEAPVAFETAGTTAATVVAISPDGKHLAADGTVTGRHAVIVRDVATGKVTHSFLGHEAAITSLSFSADGTKIVSGSSDKTARVWSLADGKFPEIARLTGHEAAVSAVAFNADASQVLTGSANNRVQSWTVADEQPVMNFAGHTGPIVGVAFGAGNVPVSASADKTVRFWNPADGKQVRAVTETVAVAAIAMVRDGARLAVATADGQIRTHQVADGKPLLTFVSGSSAAVSGLSFSTDGTRLLSASAENNARVWDAASGRLLEQVVVPSGLAGASFGPAANQLVVADAEHLVTLRTLQFERALVGNTSAVTGLVYRKNAQFVISACEDGSLRGWTPTTGAVGFTATHAAAVHDLALRPDDLAIATAGEDKLVKLWNSANGAALAPNQYQGFAGPVSAICFSADSKRLIAAHTAESGAEMLVLNAANGAVQQRLLGHAGTVLGVVSVVGSAVGQLAAGQSVSNTEKLVSASADGTVRSWQILHRGRFAGHTQPVSSLATIGRPFEIVSGSQDGTVRHWNLAAATPLVRQMNHGAPVEGVAASPDLQRFASASSNNTAKLWNATNGAQIAEMKGDVRADTRVAQLTQQKQTAEGKAAQADAEVKAAETDLPTKTAAAKTAADALAAATMDVETKAAALAAAETKKSAAEKIAIEMAAAAQLAANKMEAANQVALVTAATARLMLEKSTRMQAAATAAPDDPTLTKAAADAKAASDTAAAAAKTADAAKVAPTQAAQQAATQAQTAATAAIATQKPFTDAFTALQTSQNQRRLAEQVSTIAARELTAATDRVPKAKADLAGTQAIVQQIDAQLKAATEAAAAAIQPIRAVAFSPDSQNLATAGDFQVVHTWDATGGKPVASYVGHAGAANSLCYVSSQAILSGAVDKTTVLWNLNPGWQLDRTIGSIDNPQALISRVAAVDFSEDGQFLATGGGEPSRNGEVKVWKVADGSPVLSLPEAHTDSVNDVAFSPDGKLVGSASSDKYVRVFEISTGKQLRSFEGHTNHALGVAWHSDGRKLASCGADNAVNFWNFDSGDRIRRIAGYNRQVTAIRFFAVQGTEMDAVTVSGEGIVGLHRSNNNGRIVSFNGAAGDFLYDVAVTPSRAVLVAGGWDSKLRIWNGLQPNTQPTRVIDPPVEAEPVAGDANAVNQQASAN